MQTHTNSELKIQGFSGPPFLNDWRVAVHKPDTPAGRYILARFPVPSGQADLIAALAGFGSDGT
jgi:hypothetical protein